MADKTNPIRDTDDDARALARKLMDNANFASIAVLEPGTGVPVVSRISIAMDKEGVPVFLASELSGHSKCLGEDPRCSVMVGEPGKGDPLAHPRVTLICKAAKVDRASPQRDALREPYLERHPKAALYIDFGDFHFFRLEIERANLNGGFGKAFLLSPADLCL